MSDPFHCWNIYAPVYKNKNKSEQKKKEETWFVLVEHFILAFP